MTEQNSTHKHIYDAQGKQLCCTLEDRIYTNAGVKKLVKPTHQHTHEHSHEHGSVLKTTIPIAVSMLLLFTAIAFDHFLHPEWFTGITRILWYVAAYIPVGFPVIKEAVESIIHGEIFSEFLLMAIATCGAFAIGEYPEAVAVMLFYAIGEVFQTMAVEKAKSNIQSLIDQRPDEAVVIRNNQQQTVKAKEVLVGDIVQLRPGDKLALDGVLISEQASFNTAALTGESAPDTKAKGEVVLAGMINLNTVAQIQVTTTYADSKLSKILELVQNATKHKAPTELFIRKFARIYTPAVVALAALICVLPYFFVTNYVFNEWLYRALIFLVISCPCALVISIPLGYFGGIGAASKNGILFKGSNFIDTLASIQNVVVDKTGTITEGVFSVQQVVLQPEFNKDEILAMVNEIEKLSSHPVATAIHEYVGENSFIVSIENATEIPAHGLSATANGKELLVGNLRLLEKYGIEYDKTVANTVATLIVIAYDGKFAGYITIADKIKTDAAATIQKLNNYGIRTTMLSGDKTSVVNAVAKELNITNAFGDLLPEDKVKKVQELKAQNQSVAFVGDGINDAPVIALSDVGIAMGGLGSDAAIETADVVIQDDMPSKIPLAISISKQTKSIVWQNIGLAFAVKAIVLLLGAGGIATMWEAVFADVGVALLAILNAVRIQRMKF